MMEPDMTRGPQPADHARPFILLGKHDAERKRWPLIRRLAETNEGWVDGLSCLNAQRRLDLCDPAPPPTFCSE